jgi:predicted nucleic acid-binding protein
VPLYLADTSAWHRSGAAFDFWSDLVAKGELAVCLPVVLELAYSARGPRDFAYLQDRLAGLPSLPLDEEASAAASDAQSALVARAQHRGPRPMDLLIAAIARVHGAVLLHYDRHFDAIARVTGQPMQWLARRGSLD